MLGCYIHIPFCAAICNYCNFNRGLFDAGLKVRYVEALLAHLAREGDGSAVDTIYFGGGTPSLLEPAEVRAIVGACRQAFDVAADAEVTLEANPETVDRAALAGFREAGVNRLSYGVQSFRDSELVRLSRLHSADRARAAVTAARSAGYDNLSLDLMMWLPEQRVSEWLESVEALVDCAPEHASLYLLEVYPNAPLRDEMARAAWSLAPDDDAADMYLEAMSRLERAGYAQYEISNVARPGFESRHNLKYWTDGEWLAFGCGAHGTRQGVRWRNVSATDAYISAVAAGSGVVAETRVLTSRERFEEMMFTGLRLSRGVDVEAVRRRYGVDVPSEFREELHPFLEAGHLIYDQPFIRLSRAGMLLAHEMMTVFISPAVR
jgi:oxygen-independent coproporphyrinogen III oxidase